MLDEREFDRKQMLKNWQENNLPNVPPEFDKALRAAFAHADRDGNGLITKTELPAMLDHLLCEAMATKSKLAKRFWDFAIVRIHLEAPVYHGATSAEHRVGREPLLQEHRFGRAQRTALAGHRFGRDEGGRATRFCVCARVTTHDHVRVCGPLRARTAVQHPHNARTVPARCPHGAHTEPAVKKNL